MIWPISACGRRRATARADRIATATAAATTTTGAVADRLDDAAIAKLADRLPTSLRSEFAAIVQGLAPMPVTTAELIAAVDRISLGLGVAIGRGAAGEDARHARLIQLLPLLRAAAAEIAAEAEAKAATATATDAAGLIRDATQRR